MPIITGTHCSVSANFDSGEFISSFTITDANANGYDSSNNLQKTYKLTDEDFIYLSVTIAHAVDKFLKAKKEPAPELP
jgi:hypothetical protein